MQPPNEQRHLLSGHPATLPMTSVAGRTEAPGVESQQAPATHPPAIPFSPPPHSTPPATRRPPPPPPRAPPPPALPPPPPPPPPPARVFHRQDTPASPLSCSHPLRLLLHRAAEVPSPSPSSTGPHPGLTGEGPKGLSRTRDTDVLHPGEQAGELGIRAG